MVTFYVHLLLLLQHCLQFGIYLNMAEYPAQSTSQGTTRQSERWLSDSVCRDKTTYNVCRVSSHPAGLMAETFHKNVFELLCSVE